jgi:hypothetical protein
MVELTRARDLLPSLNSLLEISGTAVPFRAQTLSIESGQKRLCKSTACNWLQLTGMLLSGVERLQLSGRSFHKTQRTREHNNMLASLCCVAGQDHDVQSRSTPPSLQRADDSCVHPTARRLAAYEMRELSPPQGAHFSQRKHIMNSLARLRLLLPIAFFSATSNLPFLS